MKIFVKLQLKVLPESTDIFPGTTKFYSTSWPDSWVAILALITKYGNSLRKHNQENTFVILRSCFEEQQDRIRCQKIDGIFSVLKGNSSS